MDDLLTYCTLRVNKRIMAKLSYIARYEGRSRNKEIEYLIRKQIAEFEAEHGEIPMDEA